jgi:hypothetical protein
MKKIRATETKLRLLAGEAGLFSNNAAVTKWIKLLLAVLLLPVCAGAGEALWRVVRASGRADTIWEAILSGAACWVVIYLLLPKPMWVYVFGHELTHVIWTWLMGGRVKKFKASARGGHVIVTKNNFVIALAPYFFPLYAVLVLLVFAAGDRFWDLHRYQIWFHLLLGASYGFHVTLTWHILKTTQTDITEQGYLFSAVIIFLGNAFVLLIAIPLLGGQVDIRAALQWWLECTWQTVRELTQVFRGRSQ